MGYRFKTQWILILTIAIGNGVSLPSPSPASELQVGAAMARITPDPLLPVSGGMGPPNPAQKKLGELTARAVVFQLGDTRCAIVSLDLLGFPSVLCKRVTDQIAEIAPDHVLISSTHTHSAPDVYAFPDERGGHTGDLAYIDFVCKQTAQAIRDALQNLQPADLKIATGEAMGKIAYNYYAPDLYDRRMSVIQALQPDGQAIVTLVNYAIHPEVLGSDAGVVSPDLIGPLCSTIEERVGGLALFINGAQGGMVTADNRQLDQPSDPQRGYWNDERSWQECQRIGSTMAEEALRLVENSPIQTQISLECQSRDITFPVESEALWQVVTRSPLGYPHGGLNRTITTRINLVTLGTAQILTIPGEALPNIGFYLKRKMKGEHNLLFGLTNDAFGYILTRVDFDSFPRYEYISRVCLGEMTGEILIQSALELIQATAQ